MEIGLWEIAGQTGKQEVNERGSPERIRAHDLTTAYSTHCRDYPEPESDLSESLLLSPPRPHPLAPTQWNLAVLGSLPELAWGEKTSTLAP